MSDKFIWILHCPACHEGFTPSEDSWDGEISCPACRFSSTIDHGVEHEEPLQEFEIVEVARPGDHPEWPTNLSDPELDTAATLYYNLGAQHSNPESWKKIEVEYAFRRRKFPWDI